MAKRRKKEDEEAEFEMPDFDREKYMKEQINQGKTTLVSVAVAPAFAVVSFFAFDTTGEWAVGLFAGLLGLAFLKPIYQMLKLEVDELGNKGWLKNFGVYFMTLLAVWILLMNPPFGDFADPRVNELEVWILNDEGDLIDADNITMGEEYNVSFRAKITSNTEIKDDSVYITVDDGERTQMNKEEGDHYYTRTYKNVVARREPFRVKIEMEDINGNSNTVLQDVNIPPQEQ
ncbi:MAG: hypothetical protein V5A88_03815 [Candidatus Thermoplasmatota archaeon]